GAGFGDAAAVLGDVFVGGIRQQQDAAADLDAVRGAEFDEPLRALGDFGGAGGESQSVPLPTLPCPVVDGAGVGRQCIAQVDPGEHPHHVVARFGGDAHVLLGGGAGVDEFAVGIDALGRLDLVAHLLDGVPSAER